MEIEVPRRWVILKVRTDARGNVWLSLFDERGATMNPSRWRRPGRQSWVALWFFEGRAVLVPHFFQARVQRLADELPPRRRWEKSPHPTRTRLPVFVDAVGMGHERAARIVEQTLARFLAPETFEVARLQTVEKPRAPFRMPLDVLILDAGGLVAPLDSKQWVQDLKAKRGLALEPLQNVRPPDALRALMTSPRDVLVGNAKLLSEMSRELRALPLENQPRLVVTLDDRKDSSPSAPVPSAATLRTEVSGLQEGPLLKELVYGIAHDLPLHEVMSEVKRAAPVIELQADPQTNHGLRMSDAYTGLVEEAYALRAAAPAPSQRAKMTQRLHDEVELIAGLPPNFQEERTGMIPISERENDLSKARETYDELAAANGGPSPAHGPRRVDVRLKRREFTPLAAQNAVYGARLLWVGRDVVLAANTRYVLEVQVGAHHPATLLDAPPPPLDELLDQRAEEHALDVVVFGLDFRVLGDRLKPMKLRRTGAGPVVSFEVRTPREPQPAARLRVCVYRGNHVLQSFLLKAAVEPQERIATANALTVSTEFSRSERLSDLEAFKPRELALAINDTGAGTHTLMFKRGTISGTVPFAEKVLDPQIGHVRDLLGELTDADGGNRFDVEGRRPDPAHFHAAIYSLAKAGKGITRALMTNAPRLRALLRDAAGSTGKTLQVLRLANTYALPWPVLYDYWLPGAPQPICLGADDTGQPCGHTADDDAYCINGFWGVRHCIEEHLAFGDVKPAAPLPRSPLLLALGVSDAATVKLSAGLRQIAPAFAEHDIKKPLLDAIWPDAQRPSQLVVLGHLANVDPLTGDVEIVAKGGPPLLSTTRIADKLGKGPDWVAPQPLVFLMACASAAVSTSTLNSLLVSMASCGAAAVVGTECDSYSSLVGHFTHVVTRDLWNGATLGAAMRNFRRDMLRAHNPLAFVFTAVGDSETQFAPPGGA